MKNLNYKHIIALIIIAFTVLVAIGMIITAQELSQQVYSENLNGEFYNLKEEMRGDYLSGCVSESLSLEFCNCSYDYMVDKMGFDTFALEAVELYLNDHMSEYLQLTMLEALSYCLAR